MNNKKLILILSIVSLFSIFLFISCNRMNPFSSSRTVSWITIGKGLTDSTHIPPFLPKKDFYEAVGSLKKGFNLRWERAEGADYYEIRVFPKPISEKNWHEAALVATVSQQDDNVCSASVELKTQISTNYCTGCKECLTDAKGDTICPRGAISFYDGKAFIDPTKCNGCGQCYRRCNFGAIANSVMGKFYYFGIKAFAENGSPLGEVECTGSKYKMRYNNYLEECGRCGDKCFIYNEKSEFPGCPTGAIYYDKGEQDPDKIGLMYIDLDNCIYCGRCYDKCIGERGYVSIRREVIETD